MEEPCREVEDFVQCFSIDARWNWYDIRNLEAASTSTTTVREYDVFSLKKKYL